jgi:hypothetical protein
VIDSRCYLLTRAVQTTLQKPVRQRVSARDRRTTEISVFASVTHGPAAWARLQWSHNAAAGEPAPPTRATFAQ